MSLELENIFNIGSSVSLYKKNSGGTIGRKTLLNRFDRCLSMSRDEIAKRNKIALKLEEQRRQRQATWFDSRRYPKELYQLDSTPDIKLQSQPKQQVSEDFSGFTLWQEQPLATQPLTGPLRPESETEVQPHPVVLQGPQLPFSLRNFIYFREAWRLLWPDPTSW